MSSNAHGTPVYLIVEGHVRSCLRFIQKIGGPDVE